MLENAPVLIWRSDADGACDWFNATWLDFTGRRLDQEVGHGWLEMVHADDRDGCMAGFLAAFGERRPFQLEYRLRHRSGEYRWIIDHGIPLMADGSFTGYVGYCFDITERKWSEHMLAQRTAELAETNRRLTATVAELSAARGDLERLALQDTLTGLPNRRKFMQAFDFEFEQRKRQPAPLALLIMDLDHFKSINDRFGHLAGDRCLVEIAELLAANVRASDMVARFGGEEFVVLLTNADFVGTQSVCEALNRAVRETPIMVEGQPLTLTISIGGTALAPDQHVTFDQLFDAADRNVYAAKHAGRDRAVVTAWRAELG